jgi:uncharacterized protein (TIGR03067 family)
MKKVIAVVAGILLVAAEDVKESAVKKDQEKLQGTWVAVSYEFQGQKLSDDDVKKIEVEIVQNQWTAHFDTEIIKGTHQLDPTKSPKEFDGTITEGSGIGEKNLGIYEIDGDVWRQCWADPGKQRPKEFKADAAAGHNLVVWKRKKKSSEPKTHTQTVTSGMAEVAEPKIHFETAGDGFPVVLIHGGQLDRRMWDNQFQLFAQKYQVVRYDVRGYGKSEVPSRPYSDVNDLHSLLRFLRIRKAHLIGLSLGGRIAIDFTVEHPEMVESLTAVGAGLSGFDGWSAEGTKRFIEMLRTASNEGLEKATQLWLRDPMMAPAMENPVLAGRLRELTSDNAHCWLNNPRLPRELHPPAIKRLGDIRVPTHLIVGSRDDPDIHLIAKTLEKGIPQAKKSVIEGAGHMVNMEKPEEFNRVVLEFLKSLERPPK